MNWLLARLGYRLRDEPVFRARRGAAYVVLALIVVAGFGIFGQQSVTYLQGDQLGPDTGESRQDYVQRAQETVDAARQPTFALVTFARPLEPADAAEVVRPAGRVNAVVIGAASLVAVPEPVEGENRSDVFSRTLERVADGLAGLGSVPAPQRLTAVVVYDGGEVLRELSADERVATVEAVPADAPWGGFGIRPVTWTS